MKQFQGSITKEKSLHSTYYLSAKESKAFYASKQFYVLSIFLSIELADPCGNPLT